MSPSRPTQNSPTDKIRTAGRPVKDIAGGRVLRPHPRTISCHCLDPGKDGALHDLQIDVRVDPEASLKDVRGPS